MATYSFSTLLNHTSDTGFQTWVSEFTGALAAIGLEQTTDTGQLTTATLTRPAVTTSAGYQMYKFTDSAQNSLPIFLKFEFGTSNLVNVPSVWVTAASSSTGAGAITGTTWLSRIGTGATNDNPASTSTAYPSYFSYNTSTGFLGWTFKVGSVSNGTHSTLMIGRSGNSSGAITTSGVTAFVAATNASSSNRQYSINWLGSNQINGTSGRYCLSPGNRTSTAFGSDFQALLNWTAYPLIEPLNWRCTVALAELPAATTFTTTVVGSTPHTYIVIGSNGTYGDDVSANAGFSGAMIWE